MSEINQRSKLFLLLMKREILYSYIPRVPLLAFLFKTIPKDWLVGSFAPYFFYSNLEEDPSKEAVKVGDLSALFLLSNRQKYC